MSSTLRLYDYQLASPTGEANRTVRAQAAAVAAGEEIEGDEALVDVPVQPVEVALVRNGEPQ